MKNRINKEFQNEIIEEMKNILMQFKTLREAKIIVLTEPEFLD